LGMLRFVRRRSENSYGQWSYTRICSFNYHRL
jgi:hypothetical protein